MQAEPGIAPISVVIPAFNAASTLAACLNSILAQTTRPQEIIVVDDGSTDATAAVARQFSDHVRLLQQPNQGSAVARQYGTEEARCEHIAYLDGDDWWPDHTIASYARLIEDEDIHFLMADFVRAVPGAPPESYLPRNSSFYPWFLEFASEHGEATTIPELTRLPAECALEAMLRGFPYFPSASLARRSTVLAVDGWDRRFRRCQDFDLALRLTRRYPLHYYHEVQAIVDINEGNKDVKRYVIKQTTAGIGVLHAHYEAAGQDAPYQRQVSEALARKYDSLGNTYRDVGDKRSAFRAYLNAVRWPGRRAKSLVRMILLAF